VQRSSSNVTQTVDSLPLTKPSSEIAQAVDTSWNERLTSYGAIGYLNAKRVSLIRCIGYRS
jgi:hypothetical protein